MSSAWYAIRSKPNQERIVYEQLQAREIDAFLPMVRVKPVNPRSRKERPYFPGYLFAHTDIEAIGANTLNYIQGVNHLVEFGGEPAEVPEPLIAELQARIAAINDAGGVDLNAIKPGDTVRIVSGPLKGYEAIFDMQLQDEQRVQVLLDYLSRQPKRVTLRSADVERTGGH